MRFGKIVRTLGPVVAMAMAVGASGCKGARFHADEEGVPLAELDLSGDAPDSVNLVGPDIVRITEGDNFTIALEGDDEAKDRMRFVFKDHAISIMREDESWDDTGKATVTITMPGPRSIVIAGSGTLYSFGLAADSEVTIAGSGTAETMDIDVERLEVNIAGSGTYRAAGTAGKLELNIAGSGEGELAGLKVGDAEINIAGSGDATFSSDGNVKANIMGSGDVTVRGEAKCRVSSFGSGTLTCERGETVDEEG